LFVCSLYGFLSVFFVDDPASTEIYTLSLHDALPISAFLNEGCFCIFDGQSWTVTGLYLIPTRIGIGQFQPYGRFTSVQPDNSSKDRKSTRLNSSHVKISYAVFCLKKKKKINI